MIGFISDTHGGLDSTLKALDVLSECELIIHLGDVLYHGPRNDLPADYNPRELAEVLKVEEDSLRDELLELYAPPPPPEASQS